jgi:hypothetical protein
LHQSIYRMFLFFFFLKLLIVLINDKKPTLKVGLGSTREGSSEIKGPVNVFKKSKMIIFF